MIWSANSALSNLTELSRDNFDVVLFFITERSLVVNKDITAYQHSPEVVESSHQFWNRQMSSREHRWSAADRQDMTRWQKTSR